MTLDEQNEIIRTMLAAGHSYTETATALHVTKSVIAGRAHRLGLSQGISRTRWTLEMDTLIRSMWADPRNSAREIARTLGVSHTNLGARIMKLNLPPRKQGGGSRGAKPGPTTAKFSFGYQGQAKPKSVAPQPWRDPVESIPEAQRCQLLDLRPGMCKWPCGHPNHSDFYFCGGKVRRGIYCEAHTKRAYNR